MQPTEGILGFCC
uniref:Uncharacterized protein n=1 Tax=Anguilla anguilla TaxID=7936 RepID=A0A0E9VFY7_ANGAN